MQRSKGIARSAIQLSDVEELIHMRSLNYSDKSAVDAGKQAAFIVEAALGLTLPLQSQQSAISASITRGIGRDTTTGLPGTSYFLAWM
jgi:hypothetical protein